MRKGSTSVYAGHKCEWPKMRDAMVVDYQCTDFATGMVNGVWYCDTHQEKAVELQKEGGEHD